LNAENVNWKYASPGDELEAIRWYLTGRLDARTKIDAILGAAISAYEYLRHAIEHPAFPKNPFSDAYALSVFCKMPEFPRLPFSKISLADRNDFLFLFNTEQSAFFPAWILELADSGVLERFAQLALTSRERSARERAEVQIAPGKSVIAFQVNFGVGKAAVKRGFGRWLARHKARFGRESRAKAGARAKDNPCAKLKDLAAARLLALHDFNVEEASRWARAHQPRDSGGRSIPWFRSRYGSDPRSPLFKDLRDWRSSLHRFDRNVEALVA
jgi:hypothetical protein